METASIIRQADAVADAVTAYLERLPADGWTKPSDCAGWSVADLVAHLVLVEQLLGGSVTRGLAGDGGPPPHVAPGLEAWREYRAREIARLAALPKDELLAAFRDGLGPLRAAFARAQAAPDDDWRGWHPSAGPQPLAWFPGQWLVEITLHDWDLRARTDPDAEVNPVAHPALGPQMRARLPVCYRPKQANGLRGTLRIDLAGSTAWLARVDGSSIEVLDDNAARPDATIRTDAGRFALAQTGRRPASHFKQRGAWQVEGDEALADGVAGGFVGY